jgi:hypothetical protein
MLMHPGHHSPTKLMNSKRLQLCQHPQGYRLLFKAALKLNAKEGKKGSTTLLCKPTFDGLYYASQECRVPCTSGIAKKRRAASTSMHVHTAQILPRIC